MSGRIDTHKLLITSWLRDGARLPDMPDKKCGQQKSQHVQSSSPSSRMRALMTYTRIRPSFGTVSFLV